LLLAGVFQEEEFFKVEIFVFLIKGLSNYSILCGYRNHRFLQERSSGFMGGGAGEEREREREREKFIDNQR
jgi:hypothetical protein